MKIYKISIGKDTNLYIKAANGKSKKAIRGKFSKKYGIEPSKCIINEISIDKYKEIQIDTLSKILQSEFEKFKQELSKLSLDEICDKYDEIAAYKDILNVVNNLYPDDIELEALDYWISNLKLIKAEVIDKIPERDYSFDNERIVSIINREMEEK